MLEIIAQDRGVGLQTVLGLIRVVKEADLGFIEIQKLTQGQPGVLTFFNHGNAPEYKIGAAQSPEAVQGLGMKCTHAKALAGVSHLLIRNDLLSGVAGVPRRGAGHHTVNLLCAHGLNEDNQGQDNSGL